MSFTLTRLNGGTWRPGYAFGHLSDQLESLLGDFTAPYEGAFVPASDLDETKTHYFLTMDLPGIAKEDIKIEVVKGQVVVTGEKKEGTFDAKTERHRAERAHGKFVRTLSLPGEVDIDKISAQYRDGVLGISIPKAESQKAKQIQISLATEE